MKLQAIYEPKGRAAEYAKLALNLRRAHGLPCAHVMPSNEDARPAPSIALREGGTASASTGSHFGRDEAIPLFAPIVAGDVPPRPSSAVELHEGLAAPTRAEDKQVDISGCFTPTQFAMAQLVPRKSDNLQILRTVVQFIAVYVMYQFGAFQSAADHFLSHQPVLVSVARNVCVRVVRAFHSSVAVGTDCRLACLYYHVAPPSMSTSIVTPYYKTTKREVIHASYL